MAEMPRGGEERVLRPPTYEGSEPQLAYAYDFADYMGMISARAADLPDFVAALTGASVAKLPLTIEAIGIFSGRTELDSADREDYFDEPRPGGVYLFEQNPPAYAKLPFALKPGVVRPEHGALDASYRITRGMHSSVELAYHTNTSTPSQSLTIWGGVLEIRGDLDLSPATPHAAELTADVAKGYVSPEIEKKIALHTRAGQENDAEAGGETFSSHFPILIERVYSPQPYWLRRAYDPHSH